MIHVQSKRTANPVAKGIQREICPADVELLNRCFSTKTLHDVKLECNEEARQILEASLTDPSIQQALSSLRTLRNDLESSGDGPRAAAKPSASHHYGLLQYSMALGGLASRLSSPSPSALRAALLCCQVFVSIEQLRKQYASMASHTVRGLDIMHEYRARPYLDDAGKLMPARYAGLPALDIFVIKLSLSPCKFTEPPLPSLNDAMDVSGCPLTPGEQSVSSTDHPLIAPDFHAALRKIASSAIKFLNKISGLDFSEAVPQLLDEKRALLDSLKFWLIDLQQIHPGTEPSDLEPFKVSFSRFHHTTLSIILLGALTTSKEQAIELRIQQRRSQDMASAIDERVRAYTTCEGAQTKT